MDLALIFTILGTGLAIIGANIALISWLRSDMKSFEIDLRSDMKDYKNEIRMDMQSFKNEIRGWKEEIYKEMKDFHGRLCSLEGRNQPKKRTDP